MKITFNDLAGMGYESVTDYCRALMKEGLDPKTSVEVYRGDMLCLTVSSIEEGAKLEPSMDSRGFRSYRPNKHGPKALDAFK